MQVQYIGLTGGGTASAANKQEAAQRVAAAFTTPAHSWNKLRSCSNSSYSLDSEVLRCCGRLTHPAIEAHRAGWMLCFWCITELQ